MSGRQAIMIEEVRQLAIGIFDKISASGIDSVEIDQPTYWSVFPADMFLVDKPNVVLSDVEDDLADLRSEVVDAESLSALGTPWHALCPSRWRLLGVGCRNAGAVLQG
ncbi:hypothetical protein [Mesorhizobium sp. J428]|uniref:hypothetical protein n=1 Tax=Mesorhizobium sp. J428 TaxID=2898440 RepID=UPI0021516043|nr:hypothetical protein [Mesorhizobium sp. J428]MCR5856007.1 hypothetical protein [Mesorhizobium sp. J428]